MAIKAQVAYEKYIESLKIQMPYLKDRLVNWNKTSSEIKAAWITAIRAAEKLCSICEEEICLCKKEIIMWVLRLNSEPLAVFDTKDEAFAYITKCWGNEIKKISAFSWKLRESTFLHLSEVAYVRS